jgi:hypothetical protein
MYIPQKGDIVKVVDLHQQDAFYEDGEAYSFIGTLRTVTIGADKPGIHADAENGYFALGLDGEPDSPFFFGVKVEPAFGF